MTAFDPTRTYVELADGGAATPIAADERFWADLASGRRSIDGWLLMAFEMTEDFSHWEMHPGGEEIVLLMAGAVDFVLAEAQGERSVELRPGSPGLVVPRGVWHRARLVDGPARLLFVTWGEGTQHRPR